MSTSSRTTASVRSGARRSTVRAPASGMIRACKGAKVERRKGVARHQGVDREARIDRAIEARRMLGGGAVGVISRDRPGIRRRGDERAVAVERQAGRDGLVLGVAGFAARRRAASPRAP